ncbi:MAG: nuclear transport factor 2 family protein [Novosphingobium sp.]|nr:nuclear transport factor 2 family protein [Novosphingobium sp.]
MVTPAQRASLEAHIIGERAKDMDAAMAPLSENASYVIPGYVLQGKVPIRRMYEHVLPGIPTESFDEYLRALDDPAVASWGANHCVLEYTDDYPHHRNMIVVVHFDGDKVKSENTYYRTIEQRTLPMEQVFGSMDGVIPVA